MNPKGRFHGKAAVVSGGGSGIVRELCVRFASVGAKVAIPDSNLQTPRHTEQAIADRRGIALVIKADVSCGEYFKSMVRQVVNVLGNIHILVNNAGLQIRTPFLELSAED